MKQLSNQQLFTENEKTYLIFALAKKKYAIEVSQVLEVLNLPELVVPQKLPAFICGLLKYNNIIINIINMHKVLDLPTKKFTVDNQLLLLKTEDTIFGTVIDNAIDLVQISSANIHPKTYNSQNSIIKFISFINDEMIFIVDINSLENYIKENNDYFIESQSSIFEDDQSSKEIFENRKLTLQNKKKYLSPQLYIDTTDYICFLVGNNNYCIKIDYVLEILSSNINITTIPGTPDFITGVIFHHGYFYTVINTAKFFNNSANVSNSNAKIIIINDPNFKMAFLVDCINGIKKFSNDDLMSSTNKRAKNKFYSNEIIKDDKLFYILDLKNILVDNRLLIFDISEV